MHKSLATEGLHPEERSMFSIATLGIYFGGVVRLGLKLFSPISKLFSAVSLLKTKIQDESPI